MDPLLELLAKGGIGIVVAFIIARWLAAAVQTLFTKFEERAKASETRCEESNRQLVTRVQQLEDRQHSDAKEREIALRDILAVVAKAIERQADTDKFRALGRDGA